MKKLLVVLFLLAVLMCITPSAWAQTFLVSSQTVAASGAVNLAGIRTQGSQVGTHDLAYVITATVSACTVQLETSSDNVTYALMTGSAAQTCTSTGTYRVHGQVANYVRIAVTALTVSGGGKVVFTYRGHVNTPAVPTLANQPYTFAAAAKQTFAAAGTGGASLNIPAGTAPTSPVAGDIWNDSTKKTLAFAPQAGITLYKVGTVTTSATPVTATNPSSIADLMTYTLPAGFLNAAGKTIRVCGGGTYTTAAGQTPTITITHALAGVAPLAIVSAATTASASNMPWQSCMTAITVTAGASGTVESAGFLAATLGTSAPAAAAFYQGTNTAVSSAFDQTASVTGKMRVTFSSSDAGNSLTQRWITVEALN